MNSRQDAPSSEHTGPPLAKGKRAVSGLIVDSSTRTRPVMGRPPKEAMGACRRSRVESGSSSASHPLMTSTCPRSRRWAGARAPPLAGNIPPPPLDCSRYKTVSRLPSTDPWEPESVSPPRTQRDQPCPAELTPSPQRPRFFRGLGRRHTEHVRSCIRTSRCRRRKHLR